MPSYNSTARVPFNKGGRVGLKHGKWVKAPVPHADIDKYVDKQTGKEDDDKPGSRFRKEGSTMEFKKPQKSRGRPARVTRKKIQHGGRIGLKKGGGDGKWIQKATKNMRKDKPCTGKKFGGTSCPPGSKRYNLAKTFKKMGEARSRA